ncbi:hypothetical protein GCM10009105_25650 [Dokdonella soli]|uniref:Uncharacterized protein n=2 Tax=Dokdonella soli TaxID=529810 RepID=A0ABN1INL2_9GAMM
MAVMWQVQQNNQATLDSKRAEEQRRFRSDLYKEIVQARQATHEPVVAMLGLLHGVLQQVDTTWKYPQVARSNPESMKYSSQSLLKMLQDCSAATGTLHRIAEDFEVALPGSDIFKLAFSVIGEEIRASWPAFYVAAVPYIPNELVPDDHVKKLLSRSPPTTEDFKAIYDSGLPLQTACIELACAVEDFIIESQNCLISEFFTTTATRRKPSSSEHVVITLDQGDRDRIEGHFNWRRRKAQEATRIMGD